MRQTLVQQVGVVVRQGCCCGRPVWFGFADEHAIARLPEWIDDGGPGLAEIPADLALYEITRPGISD